MAKREKKHEEEEFHLLVVEDDEQVATMLRRRLERLAKVTIAASATEARERLRDHAWVAAIVDVGLPEGALAGLAVLEALRSEFPALPLLTFTGQLGVERESTLAIGDQSGGLGAFLLPKGSTEKVVAFVENAVQSSLVHERARMSLERYLIVVHHLRDREASIVVWVAGGGALKDYADREGIALTTARTHARRVCQRTGFPDLRAFIIAVQAERLGDIPDDR